MIFPVIIAVSKSKAAKACSPVKASKTAGARGSSKTASLRTFIECRKAELIIQLSFFIITQYIVCFCNFLEIFLCLRIPRIGIRMIFLGKLSVGTFDLLFIRML